MKISSKHRTSRILAALVALIALLSFTTACLMPGGAANAPRVGVEYKGEKPYEERKLYFAQNVRAMQVNVTTALGYFCYEDYAPLILTDKEPESGENNSISFSVAVYDGEKNADGSNKVEADKYTCELRENGYLYLTSEVIGEVEINASCANGSTLEALRIPISRRSFSFFDIVMLAIGLYLLYAAVSGRGRLYENEFVKPGMEKKHKLIIRLTSLVIALLMIATFAVAVLDGYGKLRIINTVLFIAVLVTFAVSMLLLYFCTDQKAKREAQQKRLAGGDVHSPSAAFVFDDDEPTVDDISKR